MHNATSCKLSVALRACASVLLACVLALAMIPVAAIGEAFAVDEGLSDEPSQEFTSSDSPGADAPCDDLSAADDTSADGSNAPNSQGEEDGVDLLSLGDEGVHEDPDDLSWMNSDRYIDGVPISSSLSRSGTGSSTYMTFSKGHHRDSDALRGIDVSEWQYGINWSQVKTSGIDFVIIRSSYGFTYKDQYFIQNVRGCLDNNIPFGVYHYARAATVAEANQEAQFVKSQLKAAGVTSSNISYPVYYDIENENQANLNASLVKDMANAFISQLNSAGYKAGVYSSTSWWQGNAPCSQLNGLEYRWIAEYNQGIGLTYSGFGDSGSALKNNDKGIWQFSSAGRVNGISTNVDLNYSYLGKFYGTASVSFNSIDSAGGTFRVAVNVTDVNQTVSKVSVPVWCSSVGGQDDLRWYTASKASDGSYYVDVSVKDHKGQVGAYTAHAYVYSRTGQYFVAGSATGINVAARNATATVASDELSVSFAANGGEYARATAVRIAVWSAKNGRDDVAWYNASKSGNTWKATVSIRNHGDVGTYYMHAYATIAGSSSLVEQMVFSISKDPGKPMYRLYNPNSGEHHYTASASERDNLDRIGWKYEGIGWYAPSGSSSPVYRLYNPNSGDHHYTASASERDNLDRIGWKYEGIGWYSDDNHGIAMYRQFNPNEKIGTHNYTSSASEIAMLVKAGWIAEGISWYGMK